MDTKFDLVKPVRLTGDGSTEITLQNYRGNVTMVTKYSTNLELIEAFSHAMQKNEVADIIDHLKKLPS